MAPLTIQQTFDLALQHHKAGRLQETEQLYRQILAQDPGHAGAMHYLGLVAHQMGRSDIAVDLIRRAIAIKPDYAEAHHGLGNVLKDQGQLDEAIAAYRRAIALRPNSTELHNNLGIVLYRKGELDAAIAAYRRTISLQPNHSGAYSNLGIALKERGQLNDAIAATRQAITLKPDFPGSHINLGIILKEAGHLDEAIAAYRQAIVLQPDHVGAHSNLGSALEEKGELDDAIASHRRAITHGSGDADAHYNFGCALARKGQLDEAIAAYRRAIALRPNYAQAHNNLGVELNKKGEFDEAIAAYHQAIALAQNYAEAHSNLGTSLTNRGQFDEAVAAYRQAIALRPDLAEAHVSLGSVLKERGQIDAAIAACRRAIALRPNYPEALSNLVLTMHYHPSCDAQVIAEEHRRWNRQHAEPLRKFIQLHGNDRNPGRRLKIGYVSPDFRGHAVAPMALPLLVCRDRENFEVFCYAEVVKPDVMTERFRVQADQWRSTVGLSDEQVANLIRRDQIDILVDLAGHTAGNRLLVFARKPAPVQITWLGYPNSTGLTAIDYRMTDAYADPPGFSDALHSERLVRLPQTNWIYQPPENCPEPGQHSAIESVRFGCFNNFAKVTEPMMKIWANILGSVAGSTLLLKAKAFTSPDVQQYVRGIFEGESISPERLELMGWEESAVNHLALYNRIAIGLDPFPYNGTATTCEALWMGVPVISLAGKTHVSRVGASLLTNVGLGELIAESPGDYIRIAVELANDRPRLRNLHETLRQRMERSPLMDAPLFARNIESAYRQMWHTWCQGG
jgi:predicted O-linked N-acetylglucosamine transferase (SPINDLY family)